MKVYLAGFDVFKPNAASVFDALCSEARELGLTPLAPVDCDPAPAGATPSEVAQHIYQCNLAKQQEADAVIANLAPFRGLEPDSGTVFEVGFAIARGIPVVGYGLPAATYADRVEAAAVTGCERDADGHLRETVSGMLVEDFGLPINLMLACSARWRSSASEALRALAGNRPGGER